MDSNRKRPRLCGVPINKNRDTSLANSIEGESIFTTTDAIVGANVFLTLCDSDESQEYLAIDGNTLAHIKQEQHKDHDETQTLPLQSYRILNQMHLPQTHAVHQQPSSPITDVSTLSVSTSSSPTAVLPATVQLPSGCEIYLVKEYVEPINTQTGTLNTRRDVSTTTVNCNEQLLTNTPALMPTSTTTTTTIKIEPGTHLATNENGTVRILHNNVSNVPCVITPRAVEAVATTTTSNDTEDAVSVNLTSSVEENSDIKRSFILEAYKKRDDKRRATHNEVERRRRDKINSWIFKLKEMLPTDVPTAINNNINNNNNLIFASSTSNGNCKTLTTAITNQMNIEQQRNALSHNINHTNRTPPSDSKSQILIKACEYIKAMQDEIKSLRECLNENEELRLRNERLQNELNVLRNVERNNNNNNNNIISTINGNNDNFNVALNTLSNTNDLFVGSRTPNNNATVATIVASTTTANSVNITTTPYTKRELIIRDYVD